MFPRETGNNAYAKFWVDKEYYGNFDIGQLLRRLQRRIQDFQKWEGRRDKRTVLSEHADWLAKG